MMEEACSSKAGPDAAPGCRRRPLLRLPALVAPHFFNVTSRFHPDQNRPPPLLISPLQARSLRRFYAVPLKLRSSLCRDVCLVDETFKKKKNGKIWQIIQLKSKQECPDFHPVSK